MPQMEVKCDGKTFIFLERAKKLLLIERVCRKHETDSWNRRIKKLVCIVKFDNFWL
jgi:hypothetical protein